MVSLFWTGLHNLQTSTQLNNSGRLSTQAKGAWKIWDRVAEVWDKIEPEEVQRLVEGMPRRVAAVIKAKGCYTKC